MVGETPQKGQNHSTSQLHAFKTGDQKPAKHLIMDDKRALTAKKADGQRKLPESRLAGNCISGRESQALEHLFDFSRLLLLIKMFRKYNKSINENTAGSQMRVSGPLSIS